jgi:hypothetical protein
MSRTTTQRLRWPLLGAAAAALTLTAAGSAADGGNFVLGQMNTATATTALIATTANPALEITNNGGGMPLSLVAPAGVSPLKVNTGIKVTNLNVDRLDDLNSTNFWTLGGNSVGSTGVLGTTTNHALELKVNGIRALRLEPTAYTPNVIGGSGNVDDGVYGATIAGGAANVVTGPGGAVGGGAHNQAGDRIGFLDSWMTVGGGSYNQATAEGSTVSGGEENWAAGPWSAVGGGFNNGAFGNAGTVAGGWYNVASSYSAVGGGNGNAASGPDSTVAGGVNNTASGPYSTVAGGAGNTADGDHATVAGGIGNTAGGANSFAAGFHAKARSDGAFVWADSNLPDIRSYGPNTFTARTTGGARFISAIDASTGDPTAGVKLAPGGGSWSSLSDRAAKRGFTPVDRRTLLERLDRVPITRWGYKSQAPSVRHLGPMAQGFYSAFGLGEDSRHIDTIDSEGVALAAIQGLYRQNQALERQNRALNSRLSRLERQMRRLLAQER